MARSVSSVKVFSAIVVDGISNAISRRGYAAASQGIASSVGSGRKSVMAKKSAGNAAEKVPWVPDPATGYYRPENHADEIDVAELRSALLKHKSKN